MIDLKLHTDPTKTGYDTVLQSIPSAPSEHIRRSEFSSRLINQERRTPSSSVFEIDDKTFRSTMPQASHWSIAWSDLMMTMFVLFLSMFVYQTAHQEFLRPGEPEIIGGDTTEALQVHDSSRASLPFDPVVRTLPLIVAGTIKKAESFPGVVETPTVKKLDEITLEKTEKQSDIFPITGKETTAEKVEPPAPEVVLEPRPLPTVDEAVSKEKFQEVYRMSQDALSNNNLENFAAIDLVPDKTMRIILTGDLLFSTGQSELSNSAKKALQEVTGFIKNTPYMVNIVGHTDNIPMRSYKFASNWELSVNRATTVARFLIDEIGMNPNQFVVSGYSSFRPLVPNTTAENRSRNRRVEIIVSKRLPKPLPLDPKNIGE